MTERLDTEIYGDDEEQTYDLTIRDMEQPLEMVIQVTSGELDVDVIDDDELSVTIRPEDGRGSDPVARVQWDGQRLEIHPVRGSGINRALRGSGTYDLEVGVPRRLLGADGGAGVSARISTASGDVRVNDLEGLLRVDSASGDISLERNAGRIECRAASGGINAEELRGHVRLTTTSGDVTLTEALVEELTVNAVSGDTHLEVTPYGRGGLDVATVSGGVNVELGLAPGSGRFALDVQTLSGSVGVTGAVERRGRRSWRIGDGPGDERPFRVRTVSGDVTVDAGSGELPDDFAAPEIPAEGKADRPRGRNDGRTEGRTDWQRIVGDVEAELHDALAGLVRGGLVPPVPPAPPAVPVPPVPPTPRNGTSHEAPPAESTESAAPAAKFDPVPVAGLDGAGATGAAPPSTDPDRERLEILRGLEEGRIDVEEAMARLDRIASAANRSTTDLTD